MFLDIDDTLNVRRCESGAELLSHQAGSSVGYPINAVREVIDWLCDLHRAGAQLIWSTTWNQHAEEYARWFGLPLGLDYVPQWETNRIAFGRSHKLIPVFTYLAEHPEITRAVILDDLVGTADTEDALASRGRILIPELDEEFGVTLKVRAQVDEFLHPAADRR